MIIYIDIDETICHSDPTDYSTATPIQENIDKANALYDAGHHIVYWTARGSNLPKDEAYLKWGVLTMKQLEEWGVKYHQFKINKPYYDLFIDDKALNTEDWI